MDDKLQVIEQKFDRLTADLGDPSVISDRNKFQAVAKERSQLEPLVEAFRALRKARADLAGSQALVDDADAEMRELARAELPAQQAAEIGRAHV